MHLSVKVLIGLCCLGVTVMAQAQYDGDLYAEASQDSSVYTPNRLGAGNIGSGSYNTQSYPNSNRNINNNNNNEGIYNVGNLNDNLPSNTPYWWVANDSPFKRVARGGESHNCLTSGCTANGQINIKDRVQYLHAGGNNDYSHNPFLNGEYQAATNNIQSTISGYNVNNNDGQFSSSDNQIILTPNGVAGFSAGPNSVSSFSAQTTSTNGGNINRQFTSGTLSGTFAGSPFSANNVGGGNKAFNQQPTQYPDVSETGYIIEKPRIPCSGQNRVCAPKDLCRNGVVPQSQLSLFDSSNQKCNPDSEVCCTVQVPVQPKPFEPQTQPCGQKFQVCVSPTVCQNGVLRADSYGVIAGKAPADKCYAPEVCCRYENTNDIISESTVLTNEGYVIKVPDNRYLPQLPDQQQQVNVFVSTPRPTPQYVPPPPTTQRYVPPPTTRPPPPTTQRYIPPVTQPPTTRYVPPQTTTQRYVPPQTTTQRYVPPPTTRPPPFKGNEYIPPDRDGSGSNDNPSILRPTQTTTRRPNRDEPILPQPIIPQPSGDNNVYIVPVGCPAAMNCTEEQFCTANGVISKQVVNLTPEQRLFRVPLTDCRDLKKGFTGKCCRDPDYVDPWPVGQLGQYNAKLLGFDDGSYRPEASSPSRGEPIASVPINRRPNPNSQFVTPIQRDQVTSSTGVCGIRNYNTQPKGAGPDDTGFGEFPWQAMVLGESKKELLCGGAIIADNTVVTTANCVYGKRTNDIMIKAGEWRLGSDEEPKAFQLIRVKAISYHPSYKPTTLNHDVALLLLEDRIKFDTHISPICIDDNDLVPSASYDNCVSTGWGHEVLKIHIQNALMHSVPVSLLAPQQCQASLASAGLLAEAQICGRSTSDTCETDIGSALACADRSGVYYLKGVYSAETSCGKSNDQVAAFSTCDAQWIRSAMANPQKYSTPQPEYVQQSNSPIGIQVNRPATPAQYLPPQYK